MIAAPISALSCVYSYPEARTRALALALNNAASRAHRIGGATSTVDLHRVQLSTVEHDNTEHVGLWS